MIASWTALKGYLYFIFNIFKFRNKENSIQKSNAQMIKIFIQISINN
jgi:hypothetical protein